MSFPVGVFIGGDFIELVDEPGKRGYVVNPMPASRDLDVLIDQFQRDDSPLPTIRLPRNKIKVVRGHGQYTDVDMSKYIAAEYHCLGMAATDCAHAEPRFKPDSAMARLPRPPSQDLPGPHSSIIKEFKSAASQAVFNEIHAGRFLVRFYHSFRLQPQDMNPMSMAEIRSRAIPQFTACVYVLKDVILKAGGSFSSASTHETSDGTAYIAVGTIILTPAPKTIGREKVFATEQDLLWSLMNFSRDQADAISLRVIHLLQRVKGCDLGYTLRMKLRSVLANMYVARGWWKEHLDSEITFTDLMIQTKQSDDGIHSSLHGLAEALETLQCHGQAADIYEYCRVEHSARFSNKLNRILTYNQQGLACLRNYDLVTAEEVFLQGFRELFEVFKARSLEQEKVKTMAKNLRWVYHEHATRLKTTAGPSQEIPSSSEFYAVLSAVLFLAGLSDSSSEGLDPGVLQPCLRNRAAARKALCDAFQICSVELFRAKLSSWMSEGLTVDAPSAGANASIRDLRKESAQNVRKDVREGKGCWHACSCPSCDQTVVFEKLLRCSKCKNAFYCGRECQVAHWKIHKLFCRQSTQS